MRPAPAESRPGRVTATVGPRPLEQGGRGQRRPSFRRPPGAPLYFAGRAGPGRWGPPLLVRLGAWPTALTRLSPTPTPTPGEHTGGGGCTAAGPAYPAPPQPGAGSAGPAQARAPKGRGGARRRAHHSNQSARGKWPAGGGARLSGRGETPADRAKALQFCGSPARPQATRLAAA